MIGTRIPAGLLKKIDKVAMAVCGDRSSAVRWLLEQGLDSTKARLLFRGLRARRRGRAVDNLIDIVAADFRADLARYAARRAPRLAKVQAEIEVLRRRERADQLRMAEADRIAFQEMNGKR